MNKTTRTAAAPVRVSSTTTISPEAAFGHFVNDLREWWPRHYTWAGDMLEDLGIEARQGGLLYEIGPYGFRCTWGRVLMWEPPHRLVFAWQIGPDRVPVPDPQKASEVELRIEPTRAEGALVELEHRGFERHGPDAAAYRAAMASENGWPYIIRQFTAYAERIAP